MGVHRKTYRQAWRRGDQLHREVRLPGDHGLHGQAKGSHLDVVVWEVKDKVKDGRRKRMVILLLVLLVRNSRMARGT